MAVRTKPEYADRNEMREYLKSRYKSAFVNMTQAAELLGSGPCSARAFFKGLPVYQTNPKEKKYFIGDIAKRIAENRVE